LNHLFRASSNSPSLPDTEALEEIGTPDPGKLLTLARRFLDEAGVERIMVESVGITENVKTWRTDVISKVAKTLPMEKVTFEGKRATMLICDYP
jgi:uncharacterized protein (DUF362 family)